jgi:Ser/Thr protein kinase RdoA (MazF antagonist)/LysM repeat protein
MKKRIFSVMFFVIIAMMLVLPASGAQTDTEEQTALQIAALINGYRADNGLYQYVYNSTLEVAAQKHTEYQASIGESTHYGEGHTTSKDRVTAEGYGAGNYIFTSEMIYAGSFATPQAALEWWKNSPIHNAIMLSTDYDEFGVGVRITNDKKYYTVDVARIKGVTSPGVGSAPVQPTLSVSAPVTVAAPNQDGSIVHVVEEGQTIQGIADAYQVPVDSLLLFNGLTESSALTAGQLILVKLPEVQPTIIVEESQSAPEPTEDQSAAPTLEQATATPIAQVTEGGGSTTQEGDSGQDNNTLLIVLVAVVVIAAVAVAAGAFLRLRKSVEEEEQEEHDRHDKDRDLDSSDFRHRPRDEQFEILREVAEMALDAYPVELISIEPRHYALNAEFQVEATPRGGGDVQQYVVRINAPGFHSQAEISSEMEWLSALNRDTDLKVPFPVRTTSGEWVETVTLSLVGEPRHCVLFQSLPGQASEMQAAPDQFEKIGAVVARLHNHGASFIPPAGFTREHWDLEGLKGGMLDVQASQAYAALAENELRVVAEAEKVVSAAMEKLGRDAQVYGLIHGDLNVKSFQVLDGQPEILDFDTCGYGYYIYDLAVVVWDLFSRDDFASLKTALLHGYRSERQLSDQEERLLMHFVAGHLMTQILTWAGRRDDPTLAEAADHAIKREVGQLEKLLDMLPS